MAGLVETSVDDFHVALLRLNRPEARNALSPEMTRAARSSELERLDADPEVRCIVIAGSDEVFAAGADITRAGRAHARRGPPDPAALAFWRARGGDRDAAGRRGLAASRSAAAASWPCRAA